MEDITPVSSPPALFGPDLDISSRVPVSDTPNYGSEQLKDYIALGCLVVNLFSSGLLSPPIQTQPRTIFDQISHFDFPLRNAVKTLLIAKWIRVFSKVVPDEEKCILRVYVLPQDVGRSKLVCGGNTRTLQTAFEQLLTHIDVSPELWKGKAKLDSASLFDVAATPEANSLFYIFNTLPSPAPRPDQIKDRYSRAATYDLLAGHGGLEGLRTTLFPYQARSAALMLQRESMPELMLDPRLELREGPDGNTYYYGSRDGSFLRHPRLYESVRGGILAETMGLGKTIICLAVILATKGHLPKIPGHYVDASTTRARVGSLSQMAISNANRHSIPAKAYLDRLCADGEEAFSVCLDQTSRSAPSYHVPVNVVRFQRKTVVPPPIKLTLCSGTIVVVPRNLVHQWELELRKHVCSGSSGLRTLVMNNPAKPLPSVDELREYDVILFSRQRFEREISDGQDRFGRRVADGATRACRCPYIGATRERDCTCLRDDDVYKSPLKQLHWLRIIIDEGHAFSSKSSNAVQVADKLVRAERRWIISGTPARHRLFGVEVEAGSEDSKTGDIEQMDSTSERLDDEIEDQLLAPNADPIHHEASRLHRRMILQRRKAYIREEEMKGAAQSLGQLATHFLKVRPWAASEFDSSRADWDEHIYRHEAQHKTYSSFSVSLRRTLEALVIKTQPEVVEKDIILPPLHQRTVYLEPSFYDKLTINLFVLVLTGNAVTSERTDQDYLFHEKSVKARNSLIVNLRQSAFFWTGFTHKMVMDAIETGEKYLSKEGILCSESDRCTLIQSLDFARLILQCRGWQALSRTHEIGLFIDEWPQDSTSSWSLAQHGLCNMIGVSHLLEAQLHVNGQILQPDAFSGLAELGAKVMAETAAVENEEERKKHTKDPVSESSAKVTMSTDTTLNETSAAKRHYQASPVKATSTKKRKHSQSIEQTEQSAQTPASPRKRKRKLSGTAHYHVPADSPVRLPLLVGTTSTKLSYLIDQVMQYHNDEKLLIFYDGDDTAYYLAQCLELLHVTHLIYAKSLTSEQKAKYIVAFDENPRIRVLIMDVRCGAEGLNVNKASRVYFINPCCRPNIEAQAIKRSHRIGQMKPVHVETLVLRGTVEEAMFKRAKLMTESEHQQAKELADDRQFADIIQNARSIPMTAQDFDVGAKMAPLNLPQQVFARDGRGSGKIKGVDVELSGEGKTPTTKKRRVTRAKAGLKADVSKEVTEKASSPLLVKNTAETIALTVATNSQSAPGTTFSLFGGG